MTLHTFAEKTAQKFTARYGRAPRWMVAAPGRVNVIGEHTDYNDGFVLPMAIERYTMIAADRPAGNGAPRINVVDAKLDGVVTIPTDSPVKPGEPFWANYMRGVIAGFQNLGVQIGSLDLLLESTVPLGGGLSSSAALEVATATLLEVTTGKHLDPVEKALLCQKAEHDFANVPCGIMDQFTSALGKENHLLLLDCRSRQTELVPMKDDGVAVLIVNTNVKHELTGGGYAQRRKQCETAAKVLGLPSLREATMNQLEAAKSKMEPVVYCRARHVIGEIARTVKAAKEIKSCNWAEVGELMYASHASLRDDYEVSCTELDCVVDIAREIGSQGGVIGCRMTGGGFGGCAVSLVRTSALENVSRKIEKDYLAKTRIQPSLFISRPAPGATVIKQ